MLHITPHLINLALKKSFSNHDEYISPYQNKFLDHSFYHPKNTPQNKIIILPYMRFQTFPKIITFLFFTSKSQVI